MLLPFWNSLRAFVRGAAPSPLLRKANDSYNVYEVAKWRAALQSARYFEKRLLTTLQFATRGELLSHALSLAPKAGLVLEFGVAGGESVRQIAAERGGRVYGFDSFEGLPENWFGYLRKGYFAQPLPRVPANVTLVKGWFSDTLEDFLRQQAGPVLGWTSAIAAYGAFVAPVVIGQQIKAGTPGYAMFGFATFYAVCLILNWWFYLRAGAEIRNP